MPFSLHIHAQVHPLTREVIRSDSIINITLNNIFTIMNINTENLEIISNQIILTYQFLSVVLGVFLVLFVIVPPC